MKFIKTILIIGSLLLIVGCQMKEMGGKLIGGEVELTASDVIEGRGYCALTASADRDGYFLMVDQLFSEGIACNTNDDCYNLLLEEDDFRSLAPEFHGYLSCEKSEGSIVPNKIKAY